MSTLENFFKTLIKGKRTRPAKTIVTEFARKFPAATQIEWIVDDEYHEAVFIDESVEKTCRFKNSGAWCDTHSNIPVDQTPRFLTSYVQDPDFIVSVIYIETSSSKFYELIVRDEDNNREIINTDESGILLVRKKIDYDING